MSVRAESTSWWRLTRSTGKELPTPLTDMDIRNSLLRDAAQSLCQSDAGSEAVDEARPGRGVGVLAARRGFGFGAHVERCPGGEVAAQLGGERGRRGE